MLFISSGFYIDDLIGKPFDNTRHKGSYKKELRSQQYGCCNSNYSVNIDCFPDLAIGIVFMRAADG